MTRTRGIVVSHDAAGRGAAGERARTLCGALGGAPGWQAMDASTFDAAALDGDPHIVIAGGDGSLHRIVNALAAARGVDNLPCVAIFPTGSGNDFARGLGLPERIAPFAAMVRDDHVRRMDLISIAVEPAVGSRRTVYAVNAVGAGLEATIAAASDRHRAWGPRLRYMWAIAGALRHPPPTWPVRIAWDDGTQEAAICTFTAANGPRTGGGLRLFPGARADDGLLDFGTVAGAARWRLALLAGSAILRLPPRSRAILRARCADCRVEADAPLPLHADGESLGEAVQAFGLTVLRGALPLVLPRPAR